MRAADQRLLQTSSSALRSPAMTQWRDSLHVSSGWWAAARSCDARPHRRNDAEQRDEMRLLRSRIETMDTIAGGSSCDAFRSSSSCRRRSSTKVLPLSCDVEARTRYGPVAATSLPRPGRSV